MRPTWNTIAARVAITVDVTLVSAPRRPVVLEKCTASAAKGVLVSLVHPDHGRDDHPIISILSS